MVYNEGMTKRAKVLWIDLEMTGLEPMEDRILEVAAIATDWNFTEIARYEAVVKVDDELMQRRMERRIVKQESKAIGGLLALTNGDEVRLLICFS